MDYQKLQPLEECNIILVFPCHININEDIVINFCLIVAKYTIYTCKKLDKPLSLLAYLGILKDKLILEEKIHIKNSTIAKFESIWGHIYETL